jgi:hypothetical protein
MKKEFATYEQTVALKELGFDEDCLMFWFKSNNGFELSNEDEYTFYSYVTAPLKQQVLRWFREKHNIDSAVLEKYKDLGKFYGGYVNQNDVRVSFGSDFKTYEEAEDACIDKLIEIIKNK